MQPTFEFLVFAAVICFGQAEVKLKQGKNATVAFEGDELSIRVENPKVDNEPLILCFGSSSDFKFKFCPQGYAGIVMNVNEREATYKLNRHGKLLKLRVDISIGGTVVFEVDGTVNVLVESMPSRMKVSLPDAFIPVKTTTALITVTRESTTNKAMIGIICGGVSLFLLFIIVGCILLYFLWYKKRTHQLVAVTMPEEERQRARHEVPELQEPLQPRILVEIPPPLKPSATTTTTTRRTSTSTTPASDEKPQAVVPPKATLRTSVVQPSEVVSVTSPSTQMEESVVTPMRKSCKSKASKKSRRRRSKTPKKTPIENQAGSSSLPADRTQSPTMQSTQAIPDYPDDPLKNAQAESSHYIKRDYLKRSEARKHAISIMLSSNGPY
uniref:Uncharacterized protein n=1 Tax=Panagrellus redivivus TaxID=6233 RepID=A0A7E4UY04_PANRE